MTETPNSAPSRAVRVAAARWRMGECATFKDFAKAVDAAVGEAARQSCELILFPEYFTTQLLTALPATEELQQLEELADRADDLCTLFAKLADKHAVTIVGGSLLRRTDSGDLVNESPVFFPGPPPTGDPRQVKIHRTPFEETEWRLVSGDRLRLFSAPWGRFAILICYDIEFPELARLAVEAGAQHLLVPYSTDDEAGHHRVRNCARARAIENSVAVTIAGNDGALPALASDPDHRGEAAHFTPCDAGFPADGVLAETNSRSGSVITVGSEARPGADLAIGTIDLPAMEEQRRSGTVRPFSDRRSDLYSLHSSLPIEWVTHPREEEPPIP